MRYETLQYGLDAGVATVTLARPETRNALDAQMRSDLAHAFRRAGGEARAVLLTGLGGDFCAGQSLGDAARIRDIQPARTQREEAAPLLEAMAECGAPILAAVEGLAAGAGAALALAADVTLADARASFAFPGAQLGLTPDAGLSWLLTQAAGPARARALLMLGEPIPAEEAAAMGLIWRVAPDGFLAVEAQDVARRLAEGPTQAHLAVRRLVREAAAAGFDAQVEAEAEALDSAGRSRDWLEGAVAFVEGRAPFFRGR